MGLCSATLDVSLKVFCRVVVRSWNIRTWARLNECWVDFIYKEEIKTFKKQTFFFFQIGIFQFINEWFTKQESLSSHWLHWPVSRNPEGMQHSLCLGELRSREGGEWANRQVAVEVGMQYNRCPRLRKRHQARLPGGGDSVNTHSLI